MSLVKIAVSASTFKALKSGSVRQALEGAQNVIAQSMPWGRGERAVAGHYAPRLKSALARLGVSKKMLAEKDSAMSVIDKQRNALLEEKGGLSKALREALSNHEATKASQASHLSGLTKGHQAEVSGLKTKSEAALAQAMSDRASEVANVTKGHLTAAAKAKTRANIMAGAAGAGGLGLGASIVALNNRRNKKAS